MSEHATRPEEAAPPADIYVGLSFEQAKAVVDEIGALWNHANHDGKKKVSVLNVLCNTLIRELATAQDKQVTT